MQDKNIVIRREEEKDRRAVEHLVRESFWNVYRPGCYEHFVLHKLRSDPAFVQELDLVMEKDGQLIGQNIKNQRKLINTLDREITALNREMRQLNGRRDSLQHVLEQYKAEQETAVFTECIRGLQR